MLLGLTGGMGCGKSTVLSLFEHMKWETIDADLICKQLYDKKDERLISPLIQRWGKDSVIKLDGSVNKKEIANIIFHSQEEINFVKSLFHSLIEETANKMIATFKTENIVFDIPLLFEGNWQDICDCTVVVWAPNKIRYERLYKRGWSKKEIDLRIKWQIDINKKLEMADYGLINTGNIDFLLKQCRELESKLLEKH